MVSSACSAKRVSGGFGLGLGFDLEPGVGATGPIPPVLVNPRYWVGGTGTWDATTTTNWSLTSGGAGGASAPTNATDVVFDQNSSASAYSVTATANSAVCLSLYVSNPATGTITWSGTISGAAGGVWGGITIASSVASFPSGTRLNATTSGNILNVGTIMPNVTANSVTGGWILAGNTSFNSGLVLTAGTFDLGGFTLTTSSFLSLGALVRTLVIGTGTLICTVSGTTFNVTGSNFSCTGTGTISLVTSGITTFAGGGFSYPVLNLGTVSPTTIFTITGANTFADLTNSVSPVTVKFTAATTTTFAKFSLSGTSGHLVTIGSVTAATHTLSMPSGTTAQSFCTISNSTATGGATWNASVSRGNVDGGSNTGWIFA